MELNSLHFASRPLGDLIQDRHARWVSLNLALHFCAEETFRLKVGRQVLRAFIHQVRINGIFLVHGDKLFLRSSPNMRSSQLDLDSRPLSYVISNVSPVCF